MHTITDKVKIGKSMYGADTIMTVAPMQVFFQNKKGDKT